MIRNTQLSLLLLLFFLTISFAKLPPKTVTLNGLIQSKTAIKKIHPSYTTNNIRFDDSTIIKNGKFSFSGKLDAPVIIAKDLRGEKLQKKLKEVL